mmetsp:Transcript_11745/g.13960  ORF Transcript_11745/g.13960 Transcript_11745/m.13960 type:complete len:178 (-) Transcript_11745:333-866(-)|eukprot:CAMPEP_0197860890 /NCGR_PEP_ID=MMETSP1438-20131217/36563_1 /TAXON_ID=1461541 /ORGANISM="Pterosperma sp., Strain CCMP1384" /LENGTH=177 /DNA_ID=CAMNT_0043477897 /DNA_START=159 /DNA_END=692 /DNA_ORIENTATION=+
MLLTVVSSALPDTHTVTKRRGTIACHSGRSFLSTPVTKAPKARKLPIQCQRTVLRTHRSQEIVQHRHRLRRFYIGASSDDNPSNSEEKQTNGEPEDIEELWPWEKSLNSRPSRIMQDDDEEEIEQDWGIAIAVTISYLVFGAIVIAGTDFEYLFSLLGLPPWGTDPDSVNAVTYFDF